MFLEFWEPSILFFRVAAPIYISTNHVEAFHFLYILANIWYLCSFWWKRFWQVGCEISLWLLFAFPWWLAVLNISSVPVSYLHLLFGVKKRLFSSSAHFFNQVVLVPVIISFILICMSWVVCVCVCLCCCSGSLLMGTGFLLLWAGSILVAGHGRLTAVAFLLWSVDFGVQAQYLWPTGLVAPQHVEPSWTTNQIRVPCIVRWILNHWTTRNVLHELFICAGL